jgi:hypothetical protein
MPTPIHWIPWDDRVKAKISRGAHNMTGRILHWPYCKRCGIVALKNDETRRVLAKPCVILEDDK